MWWRAVEVADGDGRTWRAGRGQLSVCRRGQIIRGAWTPLRFDDVTERIDMQAAAHDDAGADGETRALLSIDKAQSEVRVEPALPDGPVVVRGSESYRVHPGDTVCVYVQCPIRLRVAVSQKTLLDVPVEILKRTFFGPTKTDGDVRLTCGRPWSLDETTASDWMVTTAVQVENRARQPLDLLRLLVPMPELSLAHDEQGRLWTDDVHYVHASDDSWAHLELTGQWRRQRLGTTVLAKPTTTSAHLLLRAFSPFLSGGQA